MDVEHREKKEDPLEILRKSLVLSKISDKEYKERKKALDSTKIHESYLEFSEEFHILRLRLAYGEISLNEFWKIMGELCKPILKNLKEKEKEEKRKEKERKKEEKNMAKESKTISQTSEDKPKKHFWNR